MGKEIKVLSDLDYYKLKYEFNHIGNNLNQIARALNNRQDISLKRIEYSGVAEPCFPLKEPPNIPVKRANLSANESQ